MILLPLESWPVEVPFETLLIYVSFIDITASKGYDFRKLYALRNDTEKIFASIRVIQVLKLIFGDAKLAHVVRSAQMHLTAVRLN